MPRLAQQPLSHLLGYSLTKASLLANQVFEEAIGEPLELRRVEFTILGCIAANDDVTARQLATELAISPPNMSVVLDRLEKRGLLGRSKSGTDKRAQHLHLTPAGKTLVNKALKVSETMEEKMLARLSAGERAMLFELLQKVSGSST